MEYQFKVQLKSISKPPVWRKIGINYVSSLARVITCSRFALLSPRSILLNIGVSISRIAANYR